MADQTWRAVGLLLCVAVSGCVEDAESLPGKEPEAQSGAVEMPRWSFDDCVGWGVRESLPAALNPGSRPDALPPPLVYALSDVRYTALDCNMAEGGGFEGGPVRVVWEEHNGFTLPDDCRTPTQALTYWVLETVVVNDEGLAQTFATIDLPVVLGDIERTSEQTGAVFTEDWSWTGPGAHLSTLFMLHDGVDGLVLKDLMRWFWQGSDGMMSADYVLARENSDVITGRAGIRDFGEDMLMGQVAPLAAIISNWAFSSSAQLRPHAALPAGCGEGAAG